MNKKNILVIGDVIEDVYWTIDNFRISPETSVPLLKIDRSYTKPGGAANVALNLESLGNNITLVNTFNKLSSESQSKLLSKNIKIKQCYSNNNIPLKIRIIDNCGKCYQRIDIEKVIDTSQETLKATETELVNGSFDAIVVSDYNKGSISTNLLTYLIKYNIPCFVNLKPLDFFTKAMKVDSCSNFKLVMMNDLEFIEHYKAENFLTPKILIAKKKNINNLVITKGEKGIEVITNDAKQIQKVSEHKIKVKDTCGAGDTAFSVFTNCLLQNIDLEKTCDITNYVAGKSVEHFGTFSEIKSYYNEACKIYSGQNKC